jgi:hypothetical protein
LCLACRVLTFDQLVPDDVILLQQDMATAVELDLILVSLIVEAVEASVPKT